MSFSNAPLCNLLLDLRGVENIDRSVVTVREGASLVFEIAIIRLIIFNYITLTIAALLVTLNICSYCAMLLLLGRLHSYCVWIDELVQVTEHHQLGDS